MFLTLLLIIAHLLTPTEQQLLLSEVNYVRSQGCNCGDVFYQPTHPLKWNKDLAELARLHASEMNDHEYFSHYNQDGDDVGDRAEKVLYDWIKIGENIAVGFKSDLSVMHAWLESVEHCEMIMSPAVKEMGAARVGDYWVQNFSRKNPELVSYEKWKSSYIKR